MESPQGTRSHREAPGPEVGGELQVADPIQKWIALKVQLNGGCEPLQIVDWWVIATSYNQS